MTRTKIYLMIGLFLILDISIVLAFIYVYSGIFVDSEEKGNFLLQEYTPFTYSLMETEYKEENPNTICMVQDVDNHIISRLEYKYNYKGVNQFTLVRDKFVMGLNDSTVETVGLATTLLGNWYEQNGVDGCTYINDNDSYSRVDYYMMPYNEESTFVDNCLQLRDTNLVNVTLVATNLEEDYIYTDRSNVNGYKILRDYGYKLLNDTKYIVCNTYIQITDRLYVVVRTYVNLTCFNAVSFKDLNLVEISEWPYKLNTLDVVEANKLVNEVKNILRGQIASICLYDNMSLDKFEAPYMIINVNEWKIKAGFLGVDVSDQIKDTYFDSVYLFDDGLCFFKVLDVNSEKINAENRDNLALNFSSNLINATLINKLDEKLDGYIIRKVKGLTVNKYERLATYNIFVFGLNSILEISIVDYVHEDTDINLESLLMSLSGKIEGVDYCDA